LRWDGDTADGVLAAPESPGLSSFGAVFEPHRPAIPAGRLETGAILRLEDSAKLGDGGTAVPNLDFFGDTATGRMMRLLRLAAGNRKICAIIESASREHWSQKSRMTRASALLMVPACPAAQREKCSRSASICFSWLSRRRTYAARAGQASLR